MAVQTIKAGERESGERDSGVRLAELVAAFSLAIDLGLGQPAEHMLRSALIATRIADRLGLSQLQRDTTYYTTLIMWIGCHADSHEYARWFGDALTAAVASSPSPSAGRRRRSRAVS